MSRKLNVSVFVAAFSLAGCLGTAPSGPGSTGGTSNPNAPSAGSLGLGPTGGVGGGMGNTFDHEDNNTDPFTILERIQQEGPPEVSTKMHSCQKLKYATLGNVLSSLGVNLGNTTKNSAGVLYTGGAQAMGAPNYTARVPEAIAPTTAGATKLFDIFVQAAPEIIKAMPTAQACMVAGAATNMFNADGTCNAAGISCLQGTPATQAQIDLCNSVASQASSQTVGQTIAVATILSAAHTCE